MLLSNAQQTAALSAVVRPKSGQRGSIPRPVRSSVNCHATVDSVTLSMRTNGSSVDGGHRRRCGACRGRSRPSDVGAVAAQSCCTFGTLTLQCQRRDHRRTISLGSSDRSAIDQRIAGRGLLRVVREYPLSSGLDPSIGHATGTARRLAERLDHLDANYWRV
jgi:hypothetical protein